MKLLITGIAGFVGSRLAEFFKNAEEQIEIIGIDNLSRKGSEFNLPFLNKLGCKFIHGDIRNKEDVEELPKVDWIIDCAANPSVLAGITGGTAQLINHNLTGTLHLLEKCRKDNAGFMMLSTSRVYSIEALNTIPLLDGTDSFSVDQTKPLPHGFTKEGVTSSFSTAAPISLYGATKLASEVLALEYSYTFNIPVWVNRCGVIAGAGQFGKIDQGIFSFWIYQWLTGKPLSYIGFNGTGHQVRDFFSPQDLGILIQKQLKNTSSKKPKIVNVGGGLESALSLKELDNYCREKFNFSKDIKQNTETRPFDIPYYVTDNSEAWNQWNWKPTIKKEEILDNIFNWAQQNKLLIESGF